MYTAQTFHILKLKYVVCVYLCEPGALDTGCFLPCIVRGVLIGVGARARV